MANYDKRPLAFEAKGNGSYFYRWGITEVQRDDITSYNCDEVTIWLPLSKEVVKKTVIEYLWGGDHEKKLINEYNSVKLGVINGDEADVIVANYKVFLAERIAIKKMVDVDWNEFFE